MAMEHLKWRLSSLGSFHRTKFAGGVFSVSYGADDTGYGYLISNLSKLPIRYPLVN